MNTSLENSAIRWPNVRELFPGRDVAQEWRERLTKDQVPAFTKLSMPVNHHELLRIYRSLKSKSERHFEKGFVQKQYDVPENYHSDYYAHVLTTPTKKALEFQERIDGLRNQAWYDRSISPKRRIRSLIELNEDYDPLIDERNYTEIVPEIANSYLREFLSKFKARVTRVRFAVLRSQEGLKPHIDTVPNYSLRVHIPIQTNPYALNFGVDSKRGLLSMNMKTAEVYAINAGIVHWAHNFGNEDRVHLVVCLDGQEDLLEALS